MKKFAIGLLTAAVAFAPVAVFADSLSVTAGAAYNSNFGLRLDRDLSSAAYVQDNSPANEKVYRAEFVYNVDSVSGNGTANFRQSVFRGIGNNPGIGTCQVGPALTNAFECFHYRIFNGTTDSMTCFPYGDFCGASSVGPLILLNTADGNADGWVRACIEWSSGAANTGFMRFAVVDDTAGCDSATYQQRNLTNNQHDIQIVRMGNPQTNAFGAGETAVYFYDDFFSARTLGM